VKLSKRPLVACLWNDAHATPTGEFTQEEIDMGTPYQFTTYGLLVRSDEHLVVIAAEEGEDGRWRGLSYIPTAMVAEMTELGTPRVKRARKQSKIDGAREC
jgi:hypothetical protein